MKHLPKFKLTATPCDDEARQAAGFGWADKEVGHRHQIGGEPTILQPAAFDVPACPSCSKSMTFYAQLDSIGEEHILADCGLLYVYLCFGCFQSVSFVQSY